MKKSFLEKIWILFSANVYIEWIIKDLIIFNKNTDLITEINKWIISDKLNNERKIIFKKSFNQEIIDEFSSLYGLNEEDKKLYTVILLLRDILWHSRISVEEGRIWYTPSTDNKMKKIKSFFWIESEWDTLTIDNNLLNFNERIKIIEKIDKEILPWYAKSIWLDYWRLR